MLIIIVLTGGKHDLVAVLHRFDLHLVQYARILDLHASIRPCSRKIRTNGPRHCGEYLRLLGLVALPLWMPQGDGRLYSIRHDNSTSSE